MTKIYLFVPDGDKMTLQSSVVWLSVGRCRRDQIKLHLLENFALDNDSFLRVRDEDTDNWLDFHAHRLHPSSMFPSMHLVTAKMSIGECYNHIIDGDLDIIVKNQSKPRGFSHALLSLDFPFTKKASMNIEATPCPRVKRKNLKSELLKQAVCIAVTTGFISLIALVDYLGETLIRYIFGS